MISLTTADISWVVPFTQRELAEKCRNREIYAYKSLDEHFSKWVVPLDSLIIYIQQNPDILKYVKELDPKTVRGKELEELTEKIQVLIEQPLQYQNVTYLPQDLRDVFGIIDSNQLKQMFGKPWIFTFIRRVRYPVQSDDVLRYLRNHPEWVEKLIERHRAYLACDDPREWIIRHTLMLYTYFNKE